MSTGANPTDDNGRDIQGWDATNHAPAVPEIKTTSVDAAGTRYGATSVMRSTVAVYSLASTTTSGTTQNSGDLAVGTYTEIAIDINTTAQAGTRRLRWVIVGTATPTFTHRLNVQRK